MTSDSFLPERRSGGDEMNPNAGITRTLEATSGGGSVGTAAVVTRQAAEVQAAMMIARNFRRDRVSVHTRLMEECSRPGLAEDALYEFPRGGTRVEGPSIRLAESIARCYGNLDFGITELDTDANSTTLMAYAWDLETNTRQVRTFTVSHTRKARGKVVRLEDPRDIYEHAFNMGARRLRACILGIIPRELIDDAVSRCNRTLLEAGEGIPLIDRVRRMVEEFAKFGVTQGDIEKRIGHSLEAVSEREVANLRRVFVSLRDGIGSRTDFFGDAPVPDPTQDKTQSDVSKTQDKTQASAPKKRRKRRTKAEIAEEQMKKVLDSASERKKAREAAEAIDSAQEPKVEPAPEPEPDNFSPAGNAPPEPGPMSGTLDMGYPPGEPEITEFGE